jgi:hypothetical protein
VACFIDRKFSEFCSESTSLSKCFHLVTIEEFIEFLWWVICKIGESLPMLSRDRLSAEVPDDGSEFVVSCET